MCLPCINHILWVVLEGVPACHPNDLEESSISTLVELTSSRIGRLLEMQGAPGIIQTN